MVIEANLVDIKTVSSIYTPYNKFGAIKIEGENEDGQLVFIYIPSPIIDKLVSNIVSELVGELERITEI